MGRQIVWPCRTKKNERRQSTSLDTELLMVRSNRLSQLQQQQLCRKRNLKQRNSGLQQLTGAQHSTGAQQSTGAQAAGAQAGGAST